MGQKVNPISLRLGINKISPSKWYASKKSYVKYLHEDLKIRRFIKEKIYHAGVSRIEIERASNKMRVSIYTARPGLVIGKKGSGIDELKLAIQKLTNSEVFVNIQDVRKPEIDAQLVAESIALQVEKRVSYRRAMKRALANAFKFGAKGMKIICGGRLAGAEIARSEQYKEGRVPLHTLKADIDYGFAEAKTTYGIIGIKVMIYKGDTAYKIGSSKFISSEGIKDLKASRKKSKPAAQV